LTKSSIKNELFDKKFNQKLPDSQANQKMDMEHGTWNMEHGTWNVEHGTWNVNMEHGTWNMERRT